MEVLRHNGIEVYVPPRQVGCGMAALAVGDVETAREHALRNVRVLADLVREGYRIVCSEPTAALMLSQDYPICSTTPIPHPWPRTRSSSRRSWPSCTTRAGSGPTSSPSTSRSGITSPAT